MRSACQSLGLSLDGPSTSVVFLPNISQADKLALLKSSRALALLYTPIDEHFGIVPLEAMGSGLPVIACDSGGPLETILDQGFEHPDTTGFLRPPSRDAWSDIMSTLAQPSAAGRRTEIGAAGQKRVQERFSTDHMAKQLESVLKETLASRKFLPRKENGFLKLLLLLFFAVLLCTLLPVVMFMGPISSTEGYRSIRSARRKG
jgi:alpha-1,3/alpha-1,6-mannosyltransferase